MEEALITSKVRDYLIDHVGDMTAPGTPILDVEGGCWRVPVLCRTARAILPVGEFVLDRAGEFVSIPDGAAMLRVLGHQVERLPLLVFGGDEKALERSGAHVVRIG